MGPIDWITRQLHLFSRSRRTVLLSNLELLPLELILLITNFLATADIICLSLCSRTLKHSISICDFKPLRDRSLAFSVFTRLSRDLPRMFCCYYCAKLHRIIDVRHPACTGALVHKKCPDLGLYYREGGPLPSLRWYVSIHRLSSRYHFHHCHLIAALQNYYCGGRHGINVDTLAYTEVVDSPAVPARTTLLSVEGRVCTPAGGACPMPSLVLQIQQWMLFHDVDIASDWDAKVSEWVLLDHSICGSQTLRTQEITDEILSAIRQRGFFRDGLSTAAKCMQCSTCGVEFEISLRDCGKDGKALVVTKWLDLGAGIDPKDPKWKKKSTPIFHDPEYTHEFAYVVASSGETRRLFRESSDQESDPTPRNESYLKGRRYLYAMWRSSGGVYYLLRR